MDYSRAGLALNVNISCVRNQRRAWNRARFFLFGLKVPMMTEKQGHRHEEEVSCSVSSELGTTTTSAASRNKPNRVHMSRKLRDPTFVIHLPQHPSIRYGIGILTTVRRLTILVRLFSSSSMTGQPASGPAGQRQSSQGYYYYYYFYNKSKHSAAQRWNDSSSHARESRHAIGVNNPYIRQSITLARVSEWLLPDTSGCPGIDTICEKKIGRCSTREETFKNWFQDCRVTCART